MTMREMPAEYIAPAQKHGKKYLQEEEVINQALSIIGARLRKPGKTAISNPPSAIAMAKLMLAEEEREIFGALFLDAKHRLIAFERLFSGTIDAATVYPREVVKRALKLNAAAVIFTHNHPSGIPEPSGDDEAITRSLQSALLLIDVRVLDHIVVGGVSHVSFAARGLI